ncbi:nesprin-1 [Trichonephila inaurata madagascariensis]|uniref:Nesprin-1 n=1 Tax=Trichonephila inaurata madagascariensis TaxID=2747483 RepID=A0A8X6WUW5_9ARAC|nr:nesprin-1 [Trichonephila inaurata madagascariensis]
MSSPVGDSYRSASPRPQSAGKGHSQTSSSKSHSNNVSSKLTDTSSKSSKSDSDQKSFLEVNSDNRNRPKLKDTTKGGGGKDDQESFLEVNSDNRNRPKLKDTTKGGGGKDDQESFLSKSSEQNQKNLNRPLLSHEEDVFWTHLLSRGTNYHHPLFCEILKISQEIEGKLQSRKLCLLGVSNPERTDIFKKAMSLFLNAQSSNECVSISGQIQIVPKICFHFEKWCNLNFQHETVLICLECGCVYMTVSEISNSKSPVLEMNNYWQELASHILEKLENKPLILFHSDLFLNENRIASELEISYSCTNFKSVSESDPIITNLFLPITSSHKKSKIKLKFEILNCHSIIMTDDSHYVMIPFELKSEEFTSVIDGISDSDKKLKNEKDSKTSNIVDQNYSKSETGLLVEEENCHLDTLSHQDGSLHLKINPAVSSTVTSQEVDAIQNVVLEKHTIPETVNKTLSMPVTEKFHENETRLLSDKSLQNYTRDVVKEVVQADNIISSNVSERKELNTVVDNDSTKAFSNITSEYSTSKSLFKIPDEDTGFESIEFHSTTSDSRHKSMSILSDRTDETQKVVPSLDDYPPGFSLTSTTDPETTLQVMIKQSSEDFATHTTSKKILSQRRDIHDDTDLLLNKEEDYPPGFSLTSTTDPETTLQVMIKQSSEDFATHTTSKKILSQRRDIHDKTDLLLNKGEDYPPEFSLTSTTDPETTLQVMIKQSSEDFATHTTSKKILSQRRDIHDNTDLLLNKEQQEFSNTKVTRTSRSERKIVSSKITSFVTKSFTSKSGDTIVHTGPATNIVGSDIICSDVKQLHTSSEDKSCEIKSVSTSSSQKEYVDVSSRLDQFSKIQPESKQEKFSVLEFENKVFSPEDLPVEKLPVVEEDAVELCEDSKRQNVIPSKVFDEYNNSKTVSLERKHVKISSKTSQFAVAKSVMKQVKYSSAVQEAESSENPVIIEYEGNEMLTKPETNEEVSVISNIEGSTAYANDPTVLEYIITEPAEKISELITAEDNAPENVVYKELATESSIPMSKSTVITKTSVVSQSKRFVTVHRDMKTIICDEKNLPEKMDIAHQEYSLESPTGVDFKNLTENITHESTNDNVSTLLHNEKIFADTSKKEFADEFTTIKTEKTKKKKKKKSKNVPDNVQVQQKGTKAPCKSQGKTESEDIPSEPSEKESSVSTDISISFDSSSKKSSKEVQDDKNVSSEMQETPRTISDNIHF